MKIAFLEFPISLPGGITTFRNNLKLQFEENNHTVDTFHITLNTTRKPKLPEFTKILGFMRPEWMEEYKETLKDYDYLLFINSCPHFLKSFKDEKWKECYNIDKPKMAWIHDNYFEKYYAWFYDIPVKYKVKIVCPSDYHYNSLGKLDSMKRIIPNIVRFTNTGLHTDKKENLLIDPNEFKSIKFKHLLAEQKDNIKAKILMFGHTDTLYYSLNKEVFQDTDNFTVKNWVPIDEIYDTMRRSKIIVDFARRGNTKTIWDTTLNEGVNAGCVLLTQTPICPTFKFKYVKIEHKSDIAPTINDIINNFEKYNEMREYNLEWLKANLSPKILFKKLYDYMMEDYNVNKEGLFNLL